MGLGPFPSRASTLVRGRRYNRRMTIGSNQPLERSDTNHPILKECRGQTVLVVEDNYFVASEFEAALTDAGIEVVGMAPSAKDAIAIARTKRPTLAIMDVRLQGQRDGIDVALEMLRTAGTRCLFVTAYGDAQTRARAENAAPLGWLSKPIPKQSLVAAVKEALAKVK